MEASTSSLVGAASMEEIHRLQHKKIVIIGAGAAGLMCAAQFPSFADVTILERMDGIGKKILATGNGRCNLSNANAMTNPERFYHGDSAFAAKVLQKATPSRTMEAFGRLGLKTVTEPHTNLIYPASYQAVSVQQILNFNCRLQGVNIVSDCRVTSIVTHSYEACGFPFLVKTQKGHYPANYVVLATGGKSNPNLGSDGSGNCLAVQLGHQIVPQFPALVQLRSSSKYPGKLKGTRMRAFVAIEVDGEIRGQKEGEVLFTNYGLSGICVMELSRIVSEERKQNKESHITAVLDLVPDWEESALIHTLKTFLGNGFTPEIVLTGMMPANLAQIIAAQGLGEPERIAKIAKNWRLILTDTTGFATSQVTCGGVDTAEVNPCTLESTKQKGLYLLGELLNVDGDCGGYNLQFAWSCGILAAENIIKVGMKND